jgi:hypothetical protein
MAKGFTDEIAAWEAVFATERRSRRAVTRADAVVAVRDERLDAETTRFGAMALAHAGAKRASAAFRRFFPEAPNELVRKPLRKQAELTRDQLLPELDKLAADHPLAAFKHGLSSLAAAVLEALDARSDVKGKRAVVGNEVEEWKEGVNALRLSTYAALLNLSAEKGYRRRWADAFFKAEPDEEAEAAPPAAPGPALPA